MITAALLLAGTSSTNSYTPTLPGGFLAWWICARRKREEIGGWLLFYYWQLYSGAILSIVFFVTQFQIYVPESYDDPKKFYLSLSSIVPVLVFHSVEIAIATMLISVRTWDLLRLLRWVACAHVIALAIGVAINAFYFSDAEFVNVIALIQTAVWLAYLFKSRRVVHVFKRHDWTVAVNSMYPPEGLVTT